MRVRVHYSGQVQGVGFRATARSLARRHSVTGWVRNEPDGGVLLEIQGDELAIREALTEIRHSMGHNIRSEQSTPIADTGQEFGFEIMH